jgi:hypothetical protein
MDFNGSESSQSIMIDICPHRADMGKLLGYGKATRDSFDVCLMMMAKKIGKRSEFYLHEPTVGTKDPSRPFVANPAWPKDAIEIFLRDLCGLMFTCPPTLTGTHVHERSRYEIDIAGQEIDFPLLIMSDGRKISLTPRDVDEQNSVIHDVQTALNTIVRAIGMARGRQISVEIETRAKCPACGARNMHGAGSECSNSQCPRY